MSPRGCRPTTPLTALTIVLIFVVVGCGRLAPAETPLAATRSGAEIVRVVDGDTIEVETAGGRVVDVRLLAIDSPEKYATRYGTPDECGSEEASRFMARFSGDSATLSSDPTQDAIDRYGRLLRYVEVGHRDLGALALSRGLVMPYRFRDPAVRYRRYQVLARQAADDRRGTWGSPCNGDFHSSLPGTQNGL